MKKNRRKPIAIIVPAVLLATAAVWFFVSGNRDKRDVLEEEFLYDSVNPACNYSEHAVYSAESASARKRVLTESGVDKCDGTCYSFDNIARAP